MKYYEDSYERTIATKEEFVEFINERENHVIWLERQPVKNLRYEGCEEQLLANNLVTEEGIDYEVAVDTINTKVGTGLFVRDALYGKLYPVRTCALPSIFDRCHIGGTSLLKLDKSTLAKHLNDYNQVVTGNALIRIADEKVSAILGGDSGEYTILPAPMIVAEADKYMRSTFPKAVFNGSYYSHEYVMCEWTLAEYADDLFYALHDVLAAKKFTPVIRICTSDIGTCSATIKPLIYMSGHVIPLMSSLKTAHKHGTSLADWKESLKMSHAGYVESIEKLASLKNIEIKNGKNCMIGVMKRCTVNKAAGLEAAEVFESMNGDKATTAYDIYIAITEVMNTLQSKLSDNKVQLFRAEDNVCRCLGVDWAKYDVPGVVAW